MSELWLSDEGQVLCREHAGIPERAPRNVATVAGVRWDKLTADDLVDLAQQQGGVPVVCENPRPHGE